MTKVLLTGGSGFIAAHILDQLLKKGHSIVTTVRSEEKAKKIREAYPDKTQDQLAIVIVPDIAQPGAFDEAVKIPGLEVVLHTASPFHFKAKDPKTELIDPAVNGTTGILKAIVKSAPSVRRVVITSSFAAIMDEAHLSDPNVTYTEKSWNPVTIDEIHRSPATAYRASKTLAEKAAWEFVNNKANGAKFDLVTVNPPIVFGPVIHYLSSLESINTSNERLVQLAQGHWKNGAPPSPGAYLYVDVRDVAAAHIKGGLEIPEAGGHRLFTTAGYYSNKEIADIVRKNFPEYSDRLPAEDNHAGALPPKDQRYGFDNSETKKLLGIEWITLEKSITDTIKSLKALGA
ncbi:hypothetical protein VTK73DRAFT_4154 [Phialemonium thermophilum]|uniref:3-beta hydroxysteroid dehydrogenase/isomerase domain-containing protein n=1 Tax=Phialemonium thermophilum TaxID=223376 RepID=A0ABR3XZK3_9PEZI